ncbi:MAG: amidase [Pseudohongiellaceae bacterium]
MLTNSEYLNLDALDLACGLNNKDFTCCEVMHAAVSRAREVNPRLNAINVENFEQATSQAQIFDNNAAGLQQSPLAGLPFLIKDLSPVKGLANSFGSNLFRGHIATNNSNIVRRYLDAGLIIMGKTNTPEWGLTLTTEPVANGATRNPWNLSYSTGGSSGGAAAAVAAGILPVAHATDGGGSIRIPAANCGLVGLKPSRGLTAIENEIGACWSGMSVGHVVSQTVRDSAAFLDIITLNKPHLFPMPHHVGSFTEDLGGSLGRLRIGLQLQHPLGQEIHADCLQAVIKAAKHCEDLGHDVVEISHPVNYKATSFAMGKLINTHVYQSVKSQLKELNLTIAESPMEESTKLMATVGKDVKAADYIEALDVLKTAESTMADFHSQCDIIISPVLNMPPAELGWLDMNSPDLKEYAERFKQYSGFTALYNGTGQPSLSLPLHMTASGLPIGVMFTGAWGADKLLLKLAKQLESAQPWPRHAPLD